jgi:hypothetical protein
MSSYDDRINEISRTKIYLVKIYLDICTRTFGVSPCNATGIKCYNTIATCKYTNAYNKSSKEYKFCSLYVIHNLYNARPYVINVDFYSQELKEDNTVSGRIKIKMYDEWDIDVEMDPYWSDRYINIEQVKGTFWKKLIVRNPNYVGKRIEVYEGFDGILENEMKLMFVGTLENITFDKNTVTIEAKDILGSLSDISYPISVDVAISEDIPEIHTASSDQGMISLNAMSGDYCKRTDFLSMQLHLTPQDLGGSLTSGLYDYMVVAYDIYDRPLAKVIGSVYVDNGMGENGVILSWYSVTNASYYCVYKYNNFDQYKKTSLTYLDDLGEVWDAGTPPEEAERYYVLNGRPEILSNWSVFAGLFTIKLTNSNILPATNGWIRIEDEVINYGMNDTGTKTLLECRRGMFGTPTKRHSNITKVKLLARYEPQNPFVLLYNLLSTYVGLNNIDSTTFNNYATSWTGINFSLKPVIKDKKLSELYFDAVNMMNCNSWVNEEGKITIRKYDDEIGLEEIKDDDIIQGSDSCEFDIDERYTRVNINWHKIDLTQDDNEDNFKYQNLSISSVMESDKWYGKSREKSYKTLFINEDCGVNGLTPNDYISSLGANILSRLKKAPLIVECELEMKDQNRIRLGDVILLTSDIMCDYYGKNLNKKKFIVIKKEIVDNRVKIKLKEKF